MPSVHSQSSHYDDVNHAKEMYSPLFYNYHMLLHLYVKQIKINYHVRSNYFSVPNKLELFRVVKL